MIWGGALVPCQRPQAKAQYLVYSEDYDEFRPNSAFCEQDITYDKNGNIKRLKRTDAQGDILHDLAYTYNRNQLTKLTCNGQEYTGYTYDQCGNLTYDPVEQLHYEYNELNLPSRIFGNNGEVRYIYNSEGQKLATLTNGSFTYYRSVMVYGGITGGNEQLQYMIHPEGTIQHNNGQFAYNYHLADYAGNVRQVVAADNASSCLVVQQEMNYYPFGLAHNYNNLHRNRYLFTGKELQDQTIGNSGFLGLYDFGARYYNPMLGRWFNTDPALQTTNPYLFCGNAPTVYTDPDGEFFLSILAGIFCPALLPVTIGIDAGVIQGGARATFQGESFWSGAWKGGLTGTIGGGLSMFGGGNLSFATNFGLGVAEGAAIGTLDAILWNNNISNGVIRGGITGGIFTIITSENVNNLINGEGFRTNSNVFDRMIGEGFNKQKIIDYFDFNGVYNPNIKSNRIEGGSYWGVTRSDGSINYGDLAFENYATLKGTYIKESYHAQGIRSGKGWAQLPKEYQGLGIGSYLEEINGYNYAYKNQGLFRGHNLPLQGVEMYTQTLKLFDIPYKSYPKHLKWVYKIPRRW